MGTGAGTGYRSPMGTSEKVMQPVEAVSERILYWFLADSPVRALAERLLKRFAVTVGDLPASAAHHHAEPGELYRRSLEIVLKAARLSPCRPCCGRKG
jgi:hypothetical protein